MYLSDIVNFISSISWLGLHSGGGAFVGMEPVLRNSLFKAVLSSSLVGRAGKIPWNPNMKSQNLWPWVGKTSQQNKCWFLIIRITKKPLFVSPTAHCSRILCSSCSSQTPVGISPCWKLKWERLRNEFQAILHSFAKNTHFVGFSNCQ